MTAEPKYIHVSVAWPYANGDMHAGHLAGAYLPADIFARFHRLKGNHVLMVSGSDTHGTPISLEANKRGISPTEVFEHYHERFLLAQQKVGISYDLFTHTDTENHHQVAQDLFLKLLERDYLYKDSQQLLYSEQEDRFLPDRFVEGTCYVCGFETARGDQCDNCGNLMDATKLIKPHSKSDPDDKLIVRESEHYFLDLSQTSQDLLDYIEEHQKHWRPNVVKFTRNLINKGVEDGLRGRAYTRDLDWGIRVPVEGWENKRIYVWFEAVNGYFTASVEWAKNKGQPDEWKKWWYNPAAEVYNFIGKDNIPFHTVIWPAELMGVSGLYNDGDDTPLNLPYDVPANEFMNIEGKQFSKSRNWAIWVPDVLARYQADALRFYIARSFPESSDSDFSWEGFYTRVNNELVAAWGNLVNRMLGFAYKRFDGVVPEPGELTDDDRAIIARSEEAFDEIGKLLEQVKLKDALSQILALTKEANAYLDKREPWKTIKVDQDDAAKAVYAILRVIDNLKTLYSPFLPFSSQQLHEYLGYDGQLFGDLNIESYDEETRSHKALVYDGSTASGKWQKSDLKAGQALNKPSALFVKLDEEIIEYERGFLGKDREETPIEV